MKTQETLPFPFLISEYATLWTKPYYKKTTRAEDPIEGDCCCCEEPTGQICPECGRWICRHCADLVGFCLGC